MPIYEFKCRHCGRVFEELCRMGSNGAGMRCPGCKGKRVQRLMSRFAARSSSRSGESAPVGGSKCAGCSSGSCATCR